MFCSSWVIYIIQFVTLQRNFCNPINKLVMCLENECFVLCCFFSLLVSSIGNL